MTGILEQFLTNIVHARGTFVHSELHTLLVGLSEMDPSTICKVFFGLGTAVDLGGTLIPPFRDKIMNYGTRSITPQSTPKLSRTWLESLFESIASIQVPHTWFTHYYIVSVASSIFWAHQIYTHGQAFEYLTNHSNTSHEGMTINQVFLAWLFMAIQGSRRLHESLTLTKASQSKMWVGLWLIGIAYYIFMGLSVWIDGIGKDSFSIPFKRLTF